MQHSTPTSQNFRAAIAVCLVLILSGPFDSNAQTKSAARAQSRGKVAQRPTNPNVPTKLPAKVKRPVGAVASAKASSETSAPSPDSVRPASDWIRSSNGWTRIVRFMEAPDSPVLGQSLALAIDGQFLLLPLDAINEIKLSGNEPRFFLDDTSPNALPGAKLEARLIDLELGANLALLKADQPLYPFFPRSRIRTDLPAPGESLLTAVNTEWFKPGANFLGTKQEGETVRYEVTASSANHGAAGFYFDRVGRLVTVGSVPKEGERAWIGSTRSIWEMLGRQTTPKPASAAGFDQRRRQLAAWQERWAQTLSPARNSLSLQGLQCRQDLVALKEPELASRVRQSKSVSCENEFPLALGGGYTAGVQVLTGSVQLKDGNSDESDGAKLAQAYASDLFSAQEKQASVVNLMTVTDCQHNKVSNRQGLKVQVKFCTSALKSEDGLNDTVVSLSSVGTGAKAYVAAARLRGFNQMNTKRVLEALIENVGSFK